MTVEQAWVIVDQAVASRDKWLPVIAGRELRYDGANHFFVREGGEESYVAGSSNAVAAVLAPVGGGHVPGAVQAAKVELAADFRAADRRHNPRTRSDR